MTARIVPSLDARADEPELMDDFTINDHRLRLGLRDLELVNRFLGGHRALRLALRELFREQVGGGFHVLDLGTGGGGHVEQLVRWGAACGIELRVTAVDANPSALDYADRRLKARLSKSLRRLVSLQEGDALQLDYPDDAFDVVTTSLFLHHFVDEDCVRLLKEMHRMAARGIVVNDLHRHPAAYAGVKAIGYVLPASLMFRHDGPLSVRRGFRRSELRELARAAELPEPDIRRRWAFRLTLSTIRASCP